MSPDQPRRLGNRGPSKGFTKEARLVSIMEKFEKGVNGVRGSAVADREGLPIANGFREPFDLVAVAAMATLTAQSGKTVFDHLRFTAPRDIIIEGDDAKVVVYKLGNGEASFIALVKPETNIGLLKLEMAAASKKIEEELGLGPHTGPTIEESFLISPGGLLVAHGSRTSARTMDRDIVAGMFSAVQDFVKDTFRETGGGALEEMDLAHLRVRILRGQWTMLAIVATGAMSTAYVSAAREALKEFEATNEKSLPSWDGDAASLKGVDLLLDEVLHQPA